jgi:hypothetical protein
MVEWSLPGAGARGWTIFFLGKGWWLIYMMFYRSTSSWFVSFCPHCVDSL